MVAGVGITRQLTSIIDTFRIFKVVLRISDKNFVHDAYGLK